MVVADALYGYRRYLSGVLLMSQHPLLNGRGGRRRGGLWHRQHPLQALGKQLKELTGRGEEFFWSGPLRLLRRVSRGVLPKTQLIMIEVRKGGK